MSDRSRQRAEPSNRSVGVFPDATAAMQRALAEAERNHRRAVKDLQAQKAERPIVSATKREAYQAQLGELVMADPTTAGFTVTLPKVSKEDAGRHCTVKNASASANTITIQAPAGSTVDGAASVTSAAGYGVMHFVTDGANWWRLI